MTGISATMESESYKQSNKSPCIQRMYIHEGQEPFTAAGTSLARFYPMLWQLLSPQKVKLYTAHWACTPAQ